MEREVRYCTTQDGVRIAYAVQGVGAPLLICPYLCESFTLREFHSGIVDKIVVAPEFRQLVYYDGRGTGFSDRDVSDLSAQARMLDLSAVVEATEIDRFTLYASGLSGTPAIQYAAAHPERVAALVLYSTAAKVPVALSKQNVDTLGQLARTDWNLAAQTLMDMSSRREMPEDTAVAADVMRRSASGEAAAQLIQAAADTADVRDLLPLIRARTLVIQRTDHAVFTIEEGREVAAGIRGARLVPLPGSAAYVGPGRLEQVSEVIESFLDEHPETRRRSPEDQREGAQGSVRTILFTDLVDHSRIIRRLGDEQGRSVLRVHERLTRDVLGEHGGTEVKTLGDGFMVSFSSATRAVECAIALQRAFDRWNRDSEEQHGLTLDVRAGINAGEPVEEEGDLFGASVILASRLGSKAEGGQILVTDTVRGLCAGKNLLFSDWGDFIPRGLEDPVRVYEVRWQE